MGIQLREVPALGMVGAGKHICETITESDDTAKRKVEAGVWISLAQEGRAKSLQIRALTVSINNSKHSTRQLKVVQGM